MSIKSTVSSKIDQRYA